MKLKKRPASTKINYNVNALPYDHVKVLAPSEKFYKFMLKTLDLSAKTCLRVILDRDLQGYRGPVIWGKGEDLDQMMRNFSHRAPKKTDCRNCIMRLKCMTLMKYDVKMSFYCRIID